ncbi:MAG: outer membrane protein assembly factor BamB, partial [Stenotrophomonas sp.]|nr:outer membrane protein assembly factor BamB [Stenotrophomonas sp.]
MSQMVILKRVATVAMLGMALSGCSTVKGWFAGKDAEAKKLQEPVELVKFDATVKVDKLWTVNLGKGEERIGVR